MRRRDLLAIHKVEEFAEWAEGEGYVREKTKGIYEVLRLRRNPVCVPLIFYKKDGAKEHVTVYGGGTVLVRRYLRQLKR